MSSNARPLPAPLRDAITARGYFPDFVADSVAMALGGEPVSSHVAHLEATFAGEELHRHLTVVVLTPTRLLITHTDEGHDGLGVAGQAVTTSESIALSSIRSVALSRVVQRPEAYQPDQSEVVETWLTLGWGTMRRVDLEPAACADPNCEADHGYSGSVVSDDLTMRMSPAADGADNVAQLVRLGTALQQVVGPRLGGMA